MPNKKRYTRPAVHFKRPRCPECDSPKLAYTGSHNQGDGSMLRRTTCKKCGATFKAIIE